MRVLNVGTPLDMATKNPGEAWTDLYGCHFCGCKMYLRKESMEQPEDAVIVLVCMRCLENLTAEE